MAGIHGPAIDKETRTVRYLSASAMQLADMSTDKGCTRKYYYAYVLGLKEPPTPAMTEGTSDHGCVERYLETGERVFTPRVAKGIHMLPPPGPHLKVEHDIVPSSWHCPIPHGDGRLLGVGEHLETCKEVSGLAEAPLRAAGIPIVGRIDLLHDLGKNFGVEDVEDIEDPSGTIEVFDHKFVRTLDYALKPADMTRNIQMVAYGEYIFRTIPGVQQVRLSHGYYPKIGNARKVTKLTKREPLIAYWTEHVEPLARSIADAVKEPTPDTVPANLNACKAFNRLCMHASYCTAGSQAGLSQLVGQTASAGLLQAIKSNTDKDTNRMPLIPGKGLLAHISKPATANGVADAAAREAEIAKLKAEEKAKIVPAWFESTWNAILAFDKGQPQIGGEAAKVYGTYRGYEHKPGQAYGGSGDLGDVTISTIAEFQDLLKELQDAFPSPSPAAEPTVVVNVNTVGLVPDDAPQAASGPPTTTVASADETPKKTRAPRKPKPAVIDTTATENTATPAVTHAEPTPEPSTYAHIAADARLEAARELDTRVNLIVDAPLVEGANPFNNFAEIVDALTAAMCQKFDIVDVRSAPPKNAAGQDHGLAFGKWKGVLTAALREGDIPPGTYYLDARGNEVYEEAVQAMRMVCKRTGGYVMRGNR